MFENGVVYSSPETQDLKSLLSSEASEYSLLFNSFFGFKENPFCNTPDPQFFYMSRNHREALMSMLFGVRERRGFVVLTGAIGSGKTTLCRQFLQQLSPEIKTAVVLNPKISATHLLSSVVQDFGILARTRTRSSIYEALNRFLIEGMERSQNACLIIDEVQNLNIRTLEEVRMLSNLETSKQKLIQILLIGQPELKDILMRPALKQLRQRVGVYVHLAGLERDETQSYIEHRIRQVSDGSPQVYFDPLVAEKIYEITQGIPRLINALCDRMLMAAFARQTREITETLARTAVEELSFVCAP